MDGDRANGPDEGREQREARLLVSAPKRGRLGSLPPEQRLRQRQVYVDAKGEPQALYVLVATDTAESFDGNEAMFNTAIPSFLPKPAE